MNMNHPQKVACLAGSGVGPELMAEAARVLARLSELHSLSIEEAHLPFAGEAMTRFGWGIAGSEPPRAVQSSKPK